MNKFRLINHWETAYQVICLSCKNTITCCDNPLDEGWKGCPVCFVKWDGEFTLRNPRYTYKYKQTSYTLDNGTIVFSEKSRLIIEYADYIKARLCPTAFSVISTEPQWGRWHLYQHCELGILLSPTDKSPSVYMMEKFKKIKSEKNRKYRLRLLNKDKSTVIKVKE